jgi:hypothetical protein
MTNLTSPAAEPAVGSSNTMSDIIDSLKRLERIGSENSKTTLKLIAAAAELSRKIADQYVGHGADIVIASRSGTLLMADGSRLARNPNKRLLYKIVGGRVVNGEDNRYVAEDRDAALLFSADIASGLLELISDDLQRRNELSEERLTVLEEALEAIRPELEE